MAAGGGGGGGGGGSDEVGVAIVRLAEASFPVLHTLTQALTAFVLVFICMRSKLT